MIKISAIIVNYNNAAITGETIRSFAKAENKNIELTIIVVNNGCTEEASLEMSKHFPTVKFISTKTNLGFGGGNNVGIRSALKDHADYILLLNNDATIETNDFFDEILKVDGDIISPRVEYLLDNKKTIDYGGKVDYLFGRNYHIIEQKNAKPDYYSGVCLFIKSSVFNKLKGFDEHYFLYYEDADLCLRATRAGFKLNRCPNAKIFHHLSMSTNKLGKRKLVILANSHLRFCQQNLPLYSAPFYLLFNLYLRLKSFFL